MRDFVNPVHLVNPVYTGFILLIYFSTEIKEVIAISKFHIGLMIYTVVMVVITDFLTGVLSSVILYAILKQFFEKTASEAVTA